MLSRVAESLYWMSRYLERAEDVARILAVNFQAALDAPQLTESLTWEPIVDITGDRYILQSQYGAFTGETVSRFLIGDPANPNAILTCIERARENARSVREQISREMWEEINRLYHLVRAADVSEITRNPYTFFSDVRNGSHLFQGITDATMAHGEGWYFIQAGKYLERADKTTRILDVKYHTLAESIGTAGDTNPVAALQWIALLKSASAFEPYRRVHSQLQAWRVADFLLLDQAFPRSVYFSLGQTRAALQSTSDGGPRPGNPAERALGRLCAELEYLDIRDALADLPHYLDTLVSKINIVGDAVTQSYFVTTNLPPIGVMDRWNRQAQQQQQ
ncbi:MAG: alpha-E domain-containing protein [Anaerolineae bacterium]